MPSADSTEIQIGSENPRFLNGALVYVIQGNWIIPCHVLSSVVITSFSGLIKTGYKVKTTEGSLRQFVPDRVINVPDELVFKSMDAAWEHIIKARETNRMLLQQQRERNRNST